MPDNSLLDDFKETEIGPIPVDWEAVVIANVIDDTISGDWGKENNDEHPDWVHCQVIRGTDFPAVAAGQLANVPERYVRPSSIKKRQLQPDDMLVEISGGSKYQPTGRILRTTPQILANAHLPVLFTNFVKLFRVDRNIAESSFFHLFWEYLYSLGRTRIYEKRTTGIRNFKYKDFLANEIISLPSLPEQRCIAYVLSTIQRAIAAQDDLIAAAREVKRSLMQRLFTYGPGSEPAPTKETEIGEIPEHWKVVRLGDVLQATQYGLSVRADRTGKYPMLRMNNLDDGRIDASDLKYVDLDEGDFAKFRVRKRDVLFNRTNSYELVGKTAIFDIEGDFVFASYLIRVAPDSAQLLPEYLNYYLNWDDAQRRLKMLATRGVSQSNISATKLKRFPIGLSSIAEQEEMARILSAADHKIEAEEQRKAAFQALFKAMLHQLMTGQLRMKEVDL
ncbi:MAG: hypothetical protein E3J21_17300 [Anaerolineales bacterium]|nr:MAG: hypothetical protein E3J21_17300 [Anaerolineales bacterium]